MQITNTLLLAVLAVGANAHARIKYPPPLGAPVDGPAGNAYNAPLAADGSQFPCKGLHTAATTDKKPTATWAAGSGAHFEILGHGAGGGEGSLAAHSGGSCQASLSYDTGKTWKVLHSFEGGCPRGVALGSNMAMSANQTFPFEIPADAKAAKDALFAWTWTAVSGNRDEYYMNCAAVEITGSGTSTLDELPDMWVGDQRIPGVIKEGECASTAGSALKYPNPGEKVTKEEIPGIPFKEPSKGTCSVGGAAGGKAPAPPMGSAPAAPSAPVAPAPPMGSAPATPKPPAAPIAPAPPMGSSAPPATAPGASTIAPPRPFPPASSAPATSGSAAPAPTSGGIADVSGLELSINGQKCFCMCA